MVPRPPVSDHLPEGLSAGAMAAAVVAAGGTWTDIDVRAEVDSTNSLALAAARLGAATGTCFVADHQVAGRGRMARTWVAQPGTSAMFSVVLRALPGAAAPGLLPLAAGVAVCQAVSAASGLRAALKWPNDVLLPVGDPGADALAKCAGLLAESDPATGVFVVGVGINVAMSDQQLPVPTATSLLLSGAGEVSRDHLIGVALAGIQQWYGRWCSGDGATIVAEYSQRCATIGQDVTVDTPAGRIAGRCVGIGRGGELLLDAGGQQQALVVGDVTHVRLGAQPGLGIDGRP